MAKENYQHWRDFTDLTHLRAESFAPKEKKVLTIKTVVRETVKNNQGLISEKPVAYFEEDVLPMILNVTNCKIIEKLYGTGNVFEWEGKKIQVFATTTKVAGESVPCLRIDKLIPVSSEPEYKCCVCGKNIDAKTYNATINKYGKPYCSPDCVKVDTNGEQILK